MQDTFTGATAVSGCIFRGQRQRLLKKNSFICGGYQKRTTDCTCHHIREQVLDQIVLENLKAATAFARDNPEEFYAMAAKNGEVEARRLCINAEREERADHCKNKTA